MLTSLGLLLVSYTLRPQLLSAITYVFGIAMLVLSMLNQLERTIKKFIMKSQIV